MSMGKTLLFFIKPLDFVVTGNPKATINADFTALHMPDSAREEVTFNFSILAKAAIEKVDSVVIVSKTKYVINKVQRFFCEPRKKGWESRYSIVFSPDVFLDWFGSPSTSYALVYFPGGQAKVLLPKRLVKYAPNIAVQIRVETGWRTE